jgi:hypothetical protein
MQPDPQSCRGPIGNVRLLRACAWCGPIWAACYLIAFVVCAGFVPPPSPASSAAKIAHLFTTNANGIRIGMLLMMVTCPLFVAWGVVIAALSRRSERSFPVLSWIQIICMGVSAMIIVLIAIFWAAPTFRPGDLSPQNTRMLNDIGWLFFEFDWPPFAGWMAAIGLAMFFDRSQKPLYPRWAGYSCLCSVFLLLPASMMVFFKHGAFAWSGMFPFYLLMADFFLWVCIISVLTFRAIRRQEEIDAAAAQPGEIAVNGTVANGGLNLDLPAAVRASDVVAH